jgi:hypothetical protein
MTAPKWRHRGSDSANGGMKLGLRGLALVPDGLVDFGEDRGA